MAARRVRIFTERGRPGRVSDWRWGFKLAPKLEFSIGLSSTFSHGPYTASSLSA